MIVCVIVGESIRGQECAALTGANPDALGQEHAMPVGDLANSEPFLKQKLDCRLRDVEIEEVQRI